MGNKRDHLIDQMDLLTSLYSDFVMDDKEVLFHSITGQVSSFHDDEGNVYCAVPAFRHSDADLARDPLSTNRRLVSSEELQVFGTMVVAGATSDHIKVLIPDTFERQLSGGSATCGGIVIGDCCGSLIISAGGQSGSIVVRELGTTYIKEEAKLILGGD